MYQDGTSVPPSYDRPYPVIIGIDLIEYNSTSIEFIRYREKLLRHCYKDGTVSANYQYASAGFRAPNEGGGAAALWSAWSINHATGSKLPI